MTLDQLPPGNDAVIAAVNCKEQALRKHLLDMGLIPGTQVAMIKAAPLGDPLELRLRGYELTLRKADAACISLCRSCASSGQSTAPRSSTTPSRIETTGTCPTSTPRRSLSPKQPLHLALVGNQNCGKTTLFNQLTGANQHVGNFPGVTVERKDGVVRGHSNVTITDLPGIYSLSPYSGEEAVTRDFLLSQRPDGIINILDTTCLERSLYLTMQLMNLDIPMVLALNMMDEVRSGGGSIQVSRMEQLLGLPVVPISAAKNEGIDQLIERCIHTVRLGEPPIPPDLCGTDSESCSVQRCIHALTGFIERRARQERIPVDFAAAGFLEGDPFLLNALHLSPEEAAAAERIIAQMEAERGLDRTAALADMRFRVITALCAETVVRPRESREHIRSRRLDRVLTGKYTALPAFAGIMALVFYLTFGLLGPWLSDALALGVGWFTALCGRGLAVWGVHPVVQSLVIDGIFTGVGSILSFLPIIVVLFFFLSILEDSGYIARVAFIMDRPLRKIGLSGRSIVPLLVGFGCSVPAIMAARTLPSDRDRKMTILLTPFMSCSAKLPIYALFTAVFFPDSGARVMAALYATGILAGILYALLLQKAVFQGPPAPFVLELPNYRLPSAKNVLRLMGEKARDFAARAFTVILLASVAVWFLQTFDAGLHVAASPEDSLLALAGGWVAPILRPLGLGDWRIAAALITGFTAKESVVSTLTVLLGGSTAAMTRLLSPLSAVSFLVFSLLYTPCVAAIAAVRRELGRPWALMVVVCQCAVAWLAAFGVHWAGGLFL